MFNATQHLSFSRRLLEKRSMVSRVHPYWPPGDTQIPPATQHYCKYVPERRPHPLRLYWRNAHPCYRHANYSHFFPRRKRVLVLREAWLVKMERRSLRAMRNSSEIGL